MKYQFVPVSCLALAALGCGEVSTATPDATPQVDGSTPPDARPDNADAAAPDAIPMGPVTVTLMASGEPVADVDVVFHDADGAVLFHEKTDATGTASATVAAGSMVTAALASIFTVTEVEPGDNLLFSAGALPPISPAFLAITVAEPFPNAVDYVLSYCPSQTVVVTDLDSIPVTISNPSCFAPDGTVSIVVRARDSGGNFIGYTYGTGLELAASGPTSIVLDEPWSSELADVGTGVSNAPTTGSMSMQTAVRLNGRPYLPQNASTSLVAGGGASFLGAFPAIPGAGFAYEYNIGTVENGVQTYLADGVGAVPTLPETLVLNDFPALPEVDTLDVSQPDRFAASWQGTVAGANHALVLLSYERPDETFVNWAILVPPSAQSAQIPELPASLAARAPASGAIVHQALLAFFRTDIINGYDAARADPLLFLASDFPDVEAYRHELFGTAIPLPEGMPRQPQANLPQANLRTTLLEHILH